MSFGRPGGPEQAKRAGKSGKHGISADTQQLIDGLLKQTDMSIRQQSLVKAHLTGGAAPTVAKGNRPHVAVPTVGRGGASCVTPAQALGRFSTIRTKADMYARDPAVYDRTQFTGGAPTRNNEMEKDKLAMTMQFNGRTARERAEDVAALKRKQAARPQPAPAPAAESKEVVIDEVLAGIEERQQFLAAMVAAGRGGQYEDLIKGEIAEKLVLLQRLGVDTRPGRRR